MKQAKIIVADDDLQNANMLKRILESDHHSVITTEDGESAFRAYQSEHPDLLILDAVMPGTDGINVCKKIRQRDSQTLILLVTGQRINITPMTGLNAGADGYMNKPVAAKEFLERVHALLRRRSCEV